MTTVKDKRQFFRVATDILFRYAQCEKQHITDNIWPEKLAKTAAQTLQEQLQSLKQESQLLLNQIGEKNKALELYLNNIDKRFESISHYLFKQQETTQALRRQQLKAWISEAGIDLHLSASEGLQVDDILALEIILLPNDISISTFGKIIHKKASGRVGIEFIACKEAARQVIAKHVMQQQLKNKRDKLAKEIT